MAHQVASLGDAEAGREFVGRGQPIALSEGPGQPLTWMEHSEAAAGWEHVKRHFEVPGQSPAPADEDVKTWAGHIYRRDDRRDPGRGDALLTAIARRRDQCVSVVYKYERAAGSERHTAPMAGAESQMPRSVAAAALSHLFGAVLGTAFLFAALTQYSRSEEAHDQPPNAAVGLVMAFPLLAEIGAVVVAIVVTIIAAIATERAAQLGMVLLASSVNLGAAAIVFLFTVPTYVSDPTPWNAWLARGAVAVLVFQCAPVLCWLWLRKPGRLK